MLQGEHTVILSTFIKLPFVIKIFVLSIFEWPLKTGFTVSHLCKCLLYNEARCLNFVLSFHLHPYLVYASSKVTAESAQTGLSACCSSLQ